MTEYLIKYNGVYFHIPSLIFEKSNATSIKITLTANQDLKKKSELPLTLKISDFWSFFDYLKNSWFLQYSQLQDITAIDNPARQHRFTLVYNLLSLRFCKRFKVFLELSHLEKVYSVIPVYSNADWWEREVWDLFGIFFAGHPNLKRIMTDYGFQGHPLRKEFPLQGFVELRYSEEQKRVFYQKISTAQEFRKFSFPFFWKKS